MRRIVHSGPAPQSIAAEAASHNNPGFSPATAWGAFVEGKKEVRQRLWPLQRGLCAYCESRLSKDNCHIEHIRRKSLHPEETFNWQNLVLNCQNTDSCGHFKDRDKKQRPAVSDDPNFVKPTDTDCHRYFFYHRNGHIMPSPDLAYDNERDKARFTIDKLGLDSSRRLVRERNGILTKFCKIIDSLKDQQDALEAYFKLEFPDVGDDQSFWSARRQHRIAVERAYAAGK